MSKSSMKLHAVLAAAAFACAVGSVATANAFPVEDTPIRAHITVQQRDLTAAANASPALFHAMRANVPGAKERVAAMHVENAKRAAALGNTIPNAVTPRTLTTPYWYPADLTKSTGPTLAKTTHHALYVNYSGTIAANWGNPEGFLADLNASTMIHLADQ